MFAYYFYLPRLVIVRNRKRYLSLHRFVEKKNDNWKKRLDIFAKRGDKDFHKDTNSKAGRLTGVSRQENKQILLINYN